MDLSANANRFSAFADLYDAVRPSPPPVLAAIICRYAAIALPQRPAMVIDLGCGTGLSTRWAAGWADEVVGVDPSEDMLAVATAASGRANVTYRQGWSHATGLADAGADVVLASQALHWMDPSPTFAEVARILRPGGVFAAFDVDWPPSVGSFSAEEAWQHARARIKYYESALAAGKSVDDVRVSAVSEDALALPGYFGRDPQKNRHMIHGVRGWSKDEHLDRMMASNVFRWCREITLHGEQTGTGRNFTDMFRSQGDYQTLRKLGLSDADLGIDTYLQLGEDLVGIAPVPMLWSYRVRLGVH